MLQTDTLYVHSYELKNQYKQALHKQFENIASAPYSLLLDSAGNREIDNQISMMMWDPAIVITHQNKRTIVVDKQTNKKTISRRDPFETIDQIIADYTALLKPSKSTSSVESLPFETGIAGLIGYDIARSYMPMRTDKSDFLTPDIVVGLYTQAIIHCHNRDKQYLVYVSNSPEPETEPLDRIHFFKDKPMQSRFKLTSPWRSNLAEDDYRVALEKIQQYLIAGDCYQTNYSQQFVAKYEGNPYLGYLALRDQNNAPFSAYMTTEFGAVISVSPERFISVENGSVETKPIKGTRPRFNNKDADQASADALLASTKDQAENLMIVDLLRNDISKHCKPNSVQVPGLFELESYSAVHHMVSTIRGVLNDNTTPLQLLKDAFPGGSITGAPKVRAMEVIDELEPHKRNIYCGSIFYQGWKNDMDSSICIRTLVAENDTLFCCAGGGIVLDSVIEDEYQETFDKVARILPILEHYGQE
jgi:para-aminobenzoate synthetase component 1